MGKSLLGFLGTTTTASAAVPATFLTSRVTEGSSNSRNLIEERKEKRNWKGTKIPELSTSSEIKTKYGSVTCLSKYYGGDNGWNINSKGGNANIDQINQGCLVVEYYKQTKDQKWDGGFKLIWSFSSDQKGLVIVFKADTEEGKLKIDSSIYVLEKGDDNKWSVSFSKEDIKKDLPDNGELSNYFPSSETQIKSQETDQYWGFNPDLTKICKGSECPSETEKTITSNSWNWTKGDNGSNLSSNFGSWFNNLFGNDWSNVKTSLESLKGNWTTNSHK